MQAFITLYSHVNGKDRAALRMYHAQFPERRMPDHRIFQRSYRQLNETCSFHVTRHDAGRQRAVRSPSLEESILNGAADRPESSTRAIAHVLDSNLSCCSSRRCESSDHL
ncbi:uncharacterized protein TNCV_2543561 [Trichonephila clavipes]|nr:uncharacterized protein TNCV_2543561 [Trichonephila clavipes]